MKLTDIGFYNILFFYWILDYVMFWFFGYWTIDLLYQSTSIQKYRSRSCCTIEDMLDFAETAFTFFFVKLAEATVKLLVIKNDEIIKATGVVAFIIMI